MTTMSRSGPKMSASMLRFSFTRVHRGVGCFIG
jgi:hypothetical protein